MAILILVGGKMMCSMDQEFIYQLKIRLSDRETGSMEKEFPGRTRLLGRILVLQMDREVA